MDLNLTPDAKKAVFKTVITGTDRWIRDALPDSSQQERNDLEDYYGNGGAGYGELLAWYGLRETGLALAWYWACATGHQDAYAANAAAGVTGFYSDAVNARFPYPA